MAKAKREISEYQIVLVIASASLISLASAIEAVLIGIALGTVIDFRLAPDLLWPPDSTIVTNALLPMFVAVGFMLALATVDAIVTLQLNEHVAHLIKFEVRPHARRFLLRLLKLGHYAFLFFGCASVALWTHVYFWHGQIWTWLFSIVAVFFANGVSVLAKGLFFMDAQRARPREKHEWTVIEIMLWAMAGVLGIYSIAHWVSQHWK